MFVEKIKAKIQTLEEAGVTVDAWKAAGDLIVFTNGCFDLLHYGHIQYLAEARDMGGRLVVGLNASASVQRLKGSHRPINDELTRSFVLAALEVVDLVVVFEEDTPLDLIRCLQPDILVKGGDWRPEQIVGGDFVLSKGGSVKSLPFAEGYSTTNIEQKIIQNAGLK
jgi:D-beta-D-heptose 7-phosphate kinase/D-beta-D-heptose 1-phosphate adenosyltransferase